MAFFFYTLAKRLQSEIPHDFSFDIKSVLTSEQPVTGINRRQDRGQLMTLNQPLLYITMAGSPQVIQDWTHVTTKFNNLSV